MSASWAPLLDTASKNGGAHDLLLVRNGKRANDVQGSVYGNLGGAGGVVLQYWICDMSVGDCKCPAYGGGIGGVIFLAIVFSTRLAGTRAGVGAASGMLVDSAFNVLVVVGESRDTKRKTRTSVATQAASSGCSLSM